MRGHFLERMCLLIFHDLVFSGSQARQLVETWHDFVLFSRQGVALKSMGGEVVSALQEGNICSKRIYHYLAF